MGNRNPSRSRAGGPSCERWPKYRPARKTPSNREEGADMEKRHLPPIEELEGLEGSPLLPAKREDPPTEVRCKHELIQDQCAICAPRVNASPPRLREVTGDRLRRLGWFHASYPGTCAACGDGFEVGELICREENGYRATCCLTEGETG